MDINTLFKYGSRADVLIRSNNSQMIGDINVVPNEPYTLIKGIEIYFNYGQSNGNIDVSGNLVSNNNNYPISVELRNVPLTYKISNLIFTKKSNQTNYKTAVESLVSENNSLYLAQQVVKSVFVYNSDSVIVGYVAEGDNIVTSPDLIDGDVYTVFYNYLPSENSLVYGLDTPAHSYFCLEIFGQGNLNETTSSIYLKMCDCSLMTNKYLNFDSVSNTVNLSFDIIKTKKDYMILE